MSACSEPAPAWRAIGDVTPLRAWSSRQRGILRTIVEETFRRWVDDWGLLTDWAGSAACAEASACSDGEGDWQCLGHHDAGTAWICSGQESTCIAESLFGAGNSATPVALAVRAACERDALLRLACSLQLEAGGSPVPGDRTWAPWNGALLVTLPTGARLLVDTGAVEQVLRSRAPSELLASNAPSPVATVPVLKALAQAKMTVQVRLQGCELDAGSLQALQLGDVIRLRHGLQTPAVITNGSGRELFSGWLARSRGRKAVQLAPLGAP